VLVVVGTGAVAASLPLPDPRAPANQAILEPIWAEAKWPFALDQWGFGRAFVCAPADCGTRIEIYVRSKIGFCNCAWVDGYSAAEYAAHVKLGRRALA